MASVPPLNKVVGYLLLMHAVKTIHHYKDHILYYDFAGQQVKTSYEDFLCKSAAFVKNLSP